MDPLTTSVVIFISFFAIVYAYFKHAFGYWKSRGIPYVEPSFPLGSTNGLGVNCHCSKRIKKFYDEYKPSGAKLVGAYLLTTPCAMVLDTELIKNILIRDFAQFDDRDMYYNEVDDPLSAHLIRVDGEKWRKLRTKMSPLFSSASLKFIFPSIVEIGERFCANLHDAAMQHIGNDDGLEIRDWCSRFFIDTIGTCALGIECNCLSDPNSKFTEFASRTSLNARYGPEIMAVLSIFKNLARKFHIKTTYNDVTEFIMNVVNNKIENRQKNSVQQNDFTNLMIQLTDTKEKALTFNEIAAQSLGFFAAGLETTSLALTFCLYELSKNIEIQTKARNIIEKTLKKYNGQLTYEMIMDVPYIDQIIDETLRMYPVPFTLRKAKNDYAVPGTDIVIDKGIRLIIPIYGIHYDPAIYENPEKFDPDRFESSVKSNRDSMAWLPFGNGPRICIGQRFAMLQIKVALALVLKNFKLTLGSKMIEPISMNTKSIFLIPKNGIYLTMEPLNG